MEMMMVGSAEAPNAAGAGDSGLALIRTYGTFLIESSSTEQGSTYVLR